MFGNRNIKGPGSGSVNPQPQPRPDKSRPDKSQPRLARPEIIGILNAIIDLYSDAPMMPKIKDTSLPKTDANNLVQEPQGAPGTPRVPRVPDKLVLPECKQRGDAMLDVLDTLRTYVKYGLFERDALRREVAYLKQMVEDLGGKI